MVSPAVSPGEVGRVSAVLAGLDNIPGVTVNRYCSSSLMTIRMAAHAIKSGDGDIFVSGGVETASRFFFGMADGPKNPIFADAEARSAEHAEGGAPVWTAAEGLPDMYLAIGQTTKNIHPVQETSAVPSRMSSPSQPEPFRGEPQQWLLGG